MDGAFARSEADEEAIEHEVIATKNGYVREKSAAAEPKAGSPEIHGLASGVGYIKPEKAFAESGAPGGALGKREVEPAFGGEKSETDEEEVRAGLSEGIIQRRSGTVVEEGIRDSRCGGKEGNEYGERND